MTMWGEQLCLTATKWLLVVQQDQQQQPSGEQLVSKGLVSGALMKNSGSGEVCVRNFQSKLLGLFQAKKQGIAERSVCRLAKVQISTPCEPCGWLMLNDCEVSPHAWLFAFQFCPVLLLIPHNTTVTIKAQYKRPCD